MGSPDGVGWAWSAGRICLDSRVRLEEEGGWLVGDGGAGAHGLGKAVDVPFRVLTARAAARKPQHSCSPCRWVLPEIV